jgi:hypothetical protein
VHCAHCGYLLDSSSSFCTNCGSMTNDPQVKLDSKSETLVPQAAPRPKGKKWLLAGGAIAFLALLMSLIVPRPVTIELAVMDVNGGVFDNECALTPEGLEELGSIVTARNVSTGAVSTGDLEFRLTSDGSCRGFASVVIDPFNAFDIETKQTVLQLDGFKFFPTTYRAVQKVEVKHSLAVQLNLSVQHDYCTGNMSSWTCYGGESLGTNDGKCFGRWGYSDIGKGTSIFIVGKSNGIVSKGKLKDGDNWTLDSISSSIITCELKAARITVPHDAAGYEVTISDRGDVAFSIESLRASDWLALLTLGD